MNSEKHIENKRLLNQALNGKIDDFYNDLEGLLKKYNLDATPSTAVDACLYVIREGSFRNINLPSSKL